MNLVSFVWEETKHWLLHLLTQSYPVYLLRSRKISSSLQTLSPLPKCGRREGSSSMQENLPWMFGRYCWWIYWRLRMAFWSVTEQRRGSCLFYIPRLAQRQLCIWSNHKCIWYKNRFSSQYLTKHRFWCKFIRQILVFIVENCWNFVHI